LFHFGRCFNTDQNGFLWSTGGKLGLAVHSDAVGSRAIDVSRPLVIMMTGHTCSGKTMLSQKINRRHQLQVFHTSQIRHAIHPEMTDASDYLLTSMRYRSTVDEVYGDLLNLARTAIRNCAIGVVLDGAFLLTHLRKLVYRMCELEGARLLVVKCTCGDREQIVKRLALRRKDKRKLPGERARNFNVYKSSTTSADSMNGELQEVECETQFAEYESGLEQFEYSAGMPQPLRKFLHEALIQ
jgi:predicted kinase